MKRLIFLFPALLLAFWCASCGQETIVFDVHSLTDNPYEADTTGTVGGLAVDLNFSLLESNKKKSHVQEINRQLLQHFLGCGNLQVDQALTHFRDSMLVVYSHYEKCSSVDSTDSVAPAAKRAKVSIRVFTKLYEDDLVVYGYECANDMVSDVVCSGSLAFDIKKGKLLKEDDLFVLNDANRAAIVQLLNKRLNALKSEDTTGVVWGAVDPLKLSMNGRFEVEAASLTYHYAAGEVAPDSVGAVHITIPSFEFVPMLRKEGIVYQYWFGEK